MTASSRSSISRLRLAWDHVPGPIRRPIVWLMRSERIRLTLLDRLGIRDKSAFLTLSKGGVEAIDLAMERLASEGPSGDYYEFGLYRGYTFWHAEHAADRVGLGGMRFFGFDSFAGLPEVEGEDRRAGVFISGDYGCSRQEVEQLVSSHGFDWSRAVLVEGFFDESLTPSTRREHDMGRAALVMVDCDLYQSTVPVLAFLVDVFQEGTIVLFDDWYCFGEASDRGEPRAFREFLESHPEWEAEQLMDYPIYGKVFVMRRTAVP